MNEKLSKLGDTLAQLAAMALVVWYMVPPDERNLWLMKTAKTISRLAADLAERAGRAEMARELAGVRPAYERPYLFSRLRDFAGRFYDARRAS